MPHVHAATPDCHTCLAFAKAEASDSGDELKALGYELRDGLLVPKEAK